MHLNRSPFYLSFFLRPNDLFGLFGGALRQTSSDLETIDGAAGDEFLGQRSGEILHRPETLDEVVHHIYIEQEKGSQCRDLSDICLSQVNTGSATHRTAVSSFVRFDHLWSC